MEGYARRSAAGLRGCDQGLASLGAGFFQDLAVEAEQRERQAEPQPEGHDRLLGGVPIMQAFALGLIQRPIPPRSAAAATTKP